MIFTICYMYATFVQWWRLGALRQKLNGTLNHQNALLLCPAENVNKRCLENLLYQKDDRVACTIVPKQKIILSHWLGFPKDPKYFPIDFTSFKSNCETPAVYLLLQAHLDAYRSHKSQLIQVERFGELVAWRVMENLEIIVKSDLNYLTRLMNSFGHSDIDINHDLRLASVETVDVEGHPIKMRFSKRFSEEERLRYSYQPKHWNRFAEGLRNLYSKLIEGVQVKITVEDEKKVPVSEVKPQIKKSSKNTLEVHPARVKKTKKTSEEKKHKVKQAPAVEEVFSKTNSSVHPASAIIPSSIPPFAPTLPVTPDSSLPAVPPVTTVSSVTAIPVTSVTHVSPKTIPTITAVPSSTNVKNYSHDSVDIPAVQVCEVKAEQNGFLKSSSVPAEPARKSYSEAAQTKSLQRQDATSSKESSPNRVVKPPNILVYADSLVAKENVKSVLKTIINKEKYTVYDLPLNTSSSFWDTSTTLVIVCGNVTPALTTRLLEYLVRGGQLLCLCSDLLYTVLQTFSTAEVREHELVRFSYGDWKRVKMMHHIFCYQASPAKKQFSKESENSQHSNGSSPVAPRTPNVVDIQHNGRTYTIQVQVLGAEETWQTPSLLLATVKDCVGKAIFSQVHLEVDPTQYQDDESKYSALKDSDQARLEILKHILSNHLDIDCRNLQDANVDYTPAYLLGTHDRKLEMLNKTESIINNKLVSDGIHIEFCGKDVDPGVASATRLPVLILTCPANFSTVNYFETLDTEKIGRLVIYSDVVSSSQKLLKEKLQHGLVVIPRQQTEGKGRSNNEWLSPEGCAMFSMQLHVDLRSVLGQALPLVQHLVMVAVVSAIKSVRGLEDLDVGLKWPNDLYAHSSVKIGGLVVSSMIENQTAVVNIGCGINLSNSEPTLCLNDMISEHNKSKGLNVKHFEHEEFFAKIFNEVEELYNWVQSGHLDTLFKRYYEYWLHQDAKISVSTNQGVLLDVTVTGMDEYGYLLVRSASGKVSSVQPDGNSFDMLKGLIAPKLTN